MDTPKRIWIDDYIPEWYEESKGEHSVEYIRADLARPVVSVEEIHGVLESHKNAESRWRIAQAIHALQLPLPDQDKVREAVEALELIEQEAASAVRIGPYDDDLSPALEYARDTARQALAALQGGKP